MIATTHANLTLAKLRRCPFLPLHSYRVPVTGHSCWHTDGDAIIGDVRGHNSISANNTVAPNFCANDYDILSNPGAIADADRLAWNQVLRADGYMDAFVPVDIVGDIDTISDQYLLANFNRMRRDNMRAVTDVDAVSDRESGLRAERANCFEPREIVDEDLRANGDIPGAVDPNWSKNSGTCTEALEKEWIDQTLDCCSEPIPDFEEDTYVHETIPFACVWYEF
jgi:hypothetical protein